MEPNKEPVMSAEAGREATDVKWCGRAPAYRCIYLDEGEAEPCELHAQEGREASRSTGGDMSGRRHGFVSQTSNACACGLMLADCEVASANTDLPGRADFGWGGRLGDM